MSSPKSRPNWFRALSLAELSDGRVESVTGDAPGGHDDVLMNNRELGKLSKEQRSGDWDVWETSMHNPDFSEPWGVYGRRVDRSSDLRPAFE